MAYVSLMNHIHALVERCQYEGRPTIVLTDEGHRSPPIRCSPPTSS
ncbi:MAG: hypothetical protein NTX45_30310 [Proteobacteria bacterium]|nr:hypothetical protein [Pseudomonadota bacterium]